MRKIEEEQPELHKKLPAKFHPFMSTKFFNKFFPIHYLNVLAITKILLVGGFVTCPSVPNNMGTLDQEVPRGSPAQRTKVKY